MAFDGLVMAALTTELNSLLIGSKVMKIYQPEPADLLLHLHSAAGKHRLLMSANPSFARVSLISEIPDNPDSPSAFCMLLRKHLQGGRITKISQPGTERILEISIESANEIGVISEKKLITEIMGKHSNIILIDTESGQILECIKRISANVSRLRQLYPGIKYQYPPMQEKIDLFALTESDLRRILKAHHDPAKAIMTGIQGISPGISSYLAQYTDNREFEDGAEAVRLEIEKIRTALHTHGVKPRTYYELGSIKDFHVLPLHDYEKYYEIVEHPCVSAAIEAYYAARADSNRVSQKSSDMHRAISAKLSKLYLKKQRLLEDLKQAEDAEKYRLYGEILTANLHAVPGGKDSVTLTNYYDGASIRIPLEPKYSAAKNAQNYFKKFGKSKTALKEKQLQLKEAQIDIDYLESVLNFIEEARDLTTIDAIRDELTEQNYLKRQHKAARKNKKNVKPEPLRYMISDGAGGSYEILIGKNNIENDYLTFKLAAKTDIWMHTKDIPGSHLILRTGGVKPDEIDPEAIKQAAGIAAYHSKGKNSDNVPVDYCLAKYVKKPGGAKPGYVIFTNNKTIYAQPLPPQKSEN